LAHLTSHFAISSKILFLLPLSLNMAETAFVLFPKWSKSKTIMSASPQSTHGCFNK